MHWDQDMEDLFSHKVWNFASVSDGCEWASFTPEESYELLLTGMMLLCFLLRYH